MKMKRCGVALAAAMLAALCSFVYAGDFGGEVLGNADIIGLTRAGMAPELIIAKINTSANTFDMSTRAMIAMKENGVPDNVISAMMTAAQTSASRSSVDQARFTRELDNVAIGGETAKTAGLAWMLSNRDAVVPELQRSLMDSRPEIRAAAVRVLSNLRDQASLPAMRNLLTDSSPLVRQATAEALANLQDGPSIYAAEQAVARQVNPLDGYVRLVGYARLTQSAAALGTVVSTNPDPLNRAAAAWALGEIGRPGMAGRPALETALTSDADADVRREAVIALAKYHDANSAAILQNACRTDPAVRKVTLEAMAEYPETVEFLIGVMSLGPDQIAADELETARASLTRLTGQDLGLDGSRWADWYTSTNRSNYSGGTNAIAGGTFAPASDPFGSYGGLSAMPGDLVTTSSPTREVDLQAWSIVANPNEIPMAPNIDGSSPSRPSGFSAAALPPPPGSTGPSFSPMPGSSPAGSLELPSSLSPNDFGDIESGTGLAGSSGQASMFRTWSSEPDREIPGASDPLSAAAASGPAASSFDENIFMSGSDADSFPADPAIDGMSSTYREVPALSGADDLIGTDSSFDQPAVLSSAPVITPAPVSSEPVPAPGGISLPPGMSLPVPGMDSTPSDSFSTVAPSPDPFAMPADLSSGDSFAETDPFASPDFYTDGMSAPASAMEDDSMFASPGDDFFAQPDDSMFQPSNTGEVLFADDGSTFGSESTFPPASGFESIDTAQQDGLIDGNAWMDAPQEFAEPVAESAPVMPPPPAASTSDMALPPPPMESMAISEPTEAADEDMATVPASEEPEEKSYAQYLFVEPEPGQMVVGDPLFDVPAYSAPVATEPVAVEPVPVATTPYQPEQVQTAGTPAPEPTPQPQVSSDPDFVPRHAPAGTPMVDTRFITIPGSEESGRRRGRSDTSSQVVEEIYRPYAQQTYQPPAPPVVARPTTPSSSTSEEPGYQPPTGDVFRDPSVPLPPVRQEGTVGPTQSGEVPMLGEGMF